MPRSMQEHHPVTRTAAFLLVACLLAIQAGPGRADEACWMRYFGEPESVITDIAADGRGLWLAGRLEESGSGPFLWVARLDHQGHTLWQTRLPQRGYQLYPRLASAGRDAYWVVADTPRPSVPVRDGGSLTANALWLGQMTADGKLAKEIRLLAHRVQIVQAVAPLAGGGILLAGLASVGQELASQGWLAAVDSQGKLVWQRLLRQATWLSALHELNGATLVAGQAAGNDADMPWFATLDAKGRITRSWQPPLHGVSVQAILGVGDAIWLAGERSDPEPGARLIRYGLAKGEVQEIPVPGLSVLRLLILEPGNLLAGGDGLDSAGPGDPTGVPGWLTYPVVSYGVPQFVVPGARRIGHIGHGQLRA